MRTKRIKVKGAVYHCIGRIVGGDMLLGDEEKEFFRRMMWRVAEFCGVEIVTYCVMTNHVHLLVRVLDSEEVPDAELCRRMVKYYGRREPWVQLVAEDFENRLDPMALAKQVHQAEANDSLKLKQSRGETMRSMWRAIGNHVSE